VVVQRVEAEIGTDSVNDLGILELLGRGVSTYHGSIPSRLHNIALASKRINGYLVKPGEEFSYNAAIGEISAATGYQAAYVIQNGRTELGDGGGVCQNSTTVFRAALDAGLPISVRRGHSYRVGYYEQNAKPGLDATVFAPTVDFKFLNDTPAYILVQMMVDEPNRTLTVEIYGTSDGRKAEIKNHVVWDVTPPPPDEYIDDPTLAAGVVRQIDWRAGGAKTKFDYVVTRDGETIYEKSFFTTYRPWTAKFLRGTRVD
jgi:vancomycin resistance protein YoaR